VEHIGGEQRWFVNGVKMTQKEVRALQHSGTQ
jgi:hypothetical protein